MSVIEYNSSWPLAEFKEVAKVVTGSTPSTKKPEYHGGNIPFVKPGDLKEKGIVVSDAENYVTELGAEQGRLLPANSVMVCCIGSLGKVGYSTKPLITNQQINSLVFDEGKVYPKYGYYYCTTIQPILEHIAPNTTVAIVNKTNFSKLKIPLPPLETQKKIAGVLDKADVLRQKRRLTIDKLDELTQSVFLDMFGDPVKNPKGHERIKLEEIVEKLVPGKSFKTVEESDSGDYKVIKTGAVSWSSFNENEFKYLPEDYQPPQKHLIRKGDLLISRMNTSELVGASVLVMNDVTNYTVPDRIWRVRWKDEQSIIPFFIWQTINHRSFRKEISKIATGTSGSMKNISQKKMLSMEIPLPKISLQKEFSKIAKNIYSQIEYSKQSERKLNYLFNSLLQKAFKGELNFSDSDEPLLAAEAEGEYSV